MALHLVFAEANDCGLRSIGWFLELSGLDEFLPASYGAQQNFAAQLETLLAEFGEQEEQRLAAQMPPRQITVCEDETFPPQICLVAIEPVSNFLLLEQYATNRDEQTWNNCLDERLACWQLPAATAQRLREELIPGFYLASVAGKAKTAAERFFGQRPQSLVAWLLARLPLPGRPRCRRHNAS